jgi:hypothetical protein
MCLAAIKVRAPQRAAAEPDEPPTADCVGSDCQPDDYQAACAGWFFSCRGCGVMTAYECRIASADVPFCRRCQHLLAGSSQDMQARMHDTLLYVHAAWAKAGL